jgi:hypothetical protein
MKLRKNIRGKRNLGLSFTTVLFSKLVFTVRYGLKFYGIKYTTLQNGQVFFSWGLCRVMFNMQCEYVRTRKTILKGGGAMSGSRWGHHSLSAAHARPWLHKYLAWCLVSTRVVISHYYILCEELRGSTSVGWWSRMGRLSDFIEG